MIRRRWLVVAGWLAAIVAGVLATSQLSGLLSNTFTVPGTDSERARTVLQEHFGQRGVPGDRISTARSRRS